LRHNFYIQPQFRTSDIFTTESRGAPSFRFIACANDFRVIALVSSQAWCQGTALSRAEKLAYQLGFSPCKLTAGREALTLKGFVAARVDSCPDTIHVEVRANDPSE
jgi:hypothetical protein